MDREKNLAVVMPAGENMFYVDQRASHALYGQSRESKPGNHKTKRSDAYRRHQGAPDLKQGEVQSGPMRLIGVSAPIILTILKNLPA